MKPAKLVVTALSLSLAASTFCAVTFAGTSSAEARRLGHYHGGRPHVHPHTGAHSHRHVSGDYARHVGSNVRQAGRDVVRADSYRAGVVAGAAAVTTGAVIAGAVANNSEAQRDVYGSYSQRQAQHVAWCEGHYSSYNPNTNTYISPNGNPVRCNSPYD